MEETLDKRTAENTEAWIIGNGTASLASALYLIKYAKVLPSRVHVLDKHASLEQGSHNKGNASRGYDQFAGCLPVPGGLPMKELLAMVPSTESQGQSMLEEIQTAQANRLSAKENDHTCFMALENGCIEHIPTGSLNLSFKNRMILVCFLLKREKSLMKCQIQDFFPKSFFESVFWEVWSAQCVFGCPNKIFLLTIRLLTFYQIRLSTLAQCSRVQTRCSAISSRIPQSEHLELSRYHRLLPV